MGKIVRVRWCSECRFQRRIEGEGACCLCDNEVIRRLKPLDEGNIPDWCPLPDAPDDGLDYLRKAKKEAK